MTSSFLLFANLSARNESGKDSLLTDKAHQSGGKIHLLALGYWSSTGRGATRGTTAAAAMVLGSGGTTADRRRRPLRTRARLSLFVFDVPNLLSFSFIKFRHPLFLGHADSAVAVVAFRKVNVVDFRRGFLALLIGDVVGNTVGARSGNWNPRRPLRLREGMRFWSCFGEKLPRSDAETGDG